MATDIQTEITVMNGLAIVRGVVITRGIVIVNHGVDPGAGDDLKNSKVTGVMAACAIKIVTETI